MSRLALLLVVLLAAGCGIAGTTKRVRPPKTLSHGRFVHFANRACGRFLRGLVRREKATTFAKARVNFEKALSANERQLFTLRGLAPPASDAVAFRRMLATADDVDLLLNRLLDAVDSAQPQRVKALDKRLRRLFVRFDARAAKVGLEVCAKE